MLVCQAGTSFTQPQSNSTVPPRFGSLSAETPRASSHLAISTIATQWAPVRVATGTRSAVWSTWPWLTAMWVGSTSSAVATAAGLLGLRNGSTRTVVSPSLSSKHEWPWNLISIASVLSFWFGGFAQLLVQRPADRDADHHRHSRLFGEQRVDRRDPLVRIGGGGGLQRLGRGGTRRTSRRRRGRRRARAAAAAPPCETIRSASEKRSESVSRSIAASSRSSSGAMPAA